MIRRSIAGCRCLLRVGMMLILLACCVCAPVSALQLSSRSRVSLLTVDGGDALYTAFGHSAVRVEDPSLNLDMVFNYGTFDFNQPGFYINFMRGHMLYQLAASRFTRFMLSNTMEERHTEELPLRLDLSRRQRLFDFLADNALPENKDYRYDFFYDNCASRIRDVMETVFGDTLYFADFPVQKTFRDLLHDHLTHHPWSRLGLDLILGLPCDQAVSARELMFLPGELASAFQQATLQGVPLCDNPRSLDEIAPKKPRHPLVTLPTVCAWLLAVVGCWCSLYPAARRTFDAALFSLTGLVGLLIALLWFCTDHTATRDNLNILWALPTHILAAYGLSFGIRSLMHPWYFRLTAVLAVVVCFGWPFFPQDMHAAVIPLALLLFYRASYYAAWRKMTLWKTEKPYPTVH